LKTKKPPITPMLTDIVWPQARPYGGSVLIGGIGGNTSFLTRSSRGTVLAMPPTCFHVVAADASLFGHGFLGRGRVGGFAQAHLELGGHAVHGWTGVGVDPR
jgi:hypothetical protein